MNAFQGKIVVGAAVAVLSALLAQYALTGGGWRGFWVTEVQVLVPMAISWWVLSRD